MNFKQHFLIGLLLFALYPLIGWKVFIVFLASVLIDIDHAHIIFKEKAFTYSRIKFVFEKYRTDSENVKDIFCFFHTVEFIIVLYAFSFVYPSLIYLAIGFAFHIIIDIVYYSTIMGWPIKQWLFFIEYLRINGAV